MDHDEFLSYSKYFSEWMAAYLSGIEHYPVRPAVNPGDILNKLPASAPARGEGMDTIFSDFQDIILPGMTHWQHPGFMAYFPATNSKPSVLAEMLTAAMGAQCMLWHTSPAAEELEVRVTEWLRDLLGLPAFFAAVIQDTASTASLVALLTAREHSSRFEINEKGFRGQRYRVYASEYVHSSIDKAVRISGIGHENLVKIPVDSSYALLPGKLREAVENDISAGYQPLCVIGTFGTTSSTAVDPLYEIGIIARQYGMWFHVDAAFAGAALLLPEYRPLAAGIEDADSVVFNPHKWLFTNFDCTVYFVKDPKALTDTFSIMPEYLKTPEDKLVNNFRDWGIQLGRRFRALKLWFVIRYYGIEGLQEKIRNHIRFGQWFGEQISSDPDFELMAPVPFSLVCFRFHPAGIEDEKTLDNLNERLLMSINASGRLLLSHTRLAGKYTLRLVAGQDALEFRHMEAAWGTVRNAAALIEGE